jgi:hypothetical protein
MLISFLSAVFISSHFGCKFLKELFSAKLFLISSAAILFYNISYLVLINGGDFDKIANNYKPLFFISAFDIIYAAFLIVPLLLALSYKINIVKNK